MLENKRDYSKEAAKSGVVRGGLKNLRKAEKGSQNASLVTASV
jgi:hypothetical protein